MKKLIVISIILVSALSLAPSLTAQSEMPAPEGLRSKRKSMERPRIVILPGERPSDSLMAVLQNELTDQLTANLSDLGRHELADRRDLERILAEQSLQLTGIISDSASAELGRIMSAKEALILHLVSFSQKGVPPEDEDEGEDLSFGEQLILALVEAAVTSDETPAEEYAGNIQTVMSVTVRYLDLESGRTLDSFTLNALHTGGAAGKSRTAAMQMLRSQMFQRLNEMFLLNIRFAGRNGETLLFTPGLSLGIRPGMLFSLQSAPETLNLNGEELQLPGRPLGYIRSTLVSDKLFEAEALRRFGDWGQDIQGVEIVSHPFASRWSLDLAESSAGASVGLVINGLYPVSTLMSVGYRNFEDSRGERTHGLMLQILPVGKLGGALPMNLEAGLNLELHLLGRGDDGGHTVTAAAFGIGPQLGLRLMLDRNSDLILTAGYRLFGHSSWEYTVTGKDDDDSISYPAVWDAPAPEVLGQGLYFSLSVQNFSF